MLAILRLVVAIAFMVSAGLANAQVIGASSCKREEAKLFLPLAGRWSVDWTDRVAPGQYAKTRASARIETDMLGCALVEHFESTRQGQPFTAVVIISFGNSEALQRALLDSSHGQFVLFDGAQDGKIVRFEWARALPGRKLMLRHEYREFQRNSFETETRLSTDGGATWDVVQRAKYQRE